MTHSRDMAIGSLANLVTLLIGLLVGFLCGMLYSHHSSVLAQSRPTPPPVVEEITPAFAMPTFAAGIILVHDLEADGLTVNGYDVLKMQQGILNYLANRPLAERPDIENIINQARAPHLYTMKPAAGTQPQSPPQTPPPAQEKPKQ